MTEEPPTSSGAPGPGPVQAGPRIVVLGLGGAGGNAVDNMIRSKLEGVEFLVANTDAQALEQSLCEHKVQLGRGVTEGLGAGSRPEVGKAATEESLAEIHSAIAGAHMLFVTAGMGGGTGTGGAPVIARAAREAGILTVGVITKPFHFEGARRMRLAEGGISELSQHVDTLIVIPNQNLFRVSDEKTTFADAFRIADEVLHSGVRGVTDLMVMPGLINLDFADIQSVMAEMGKAIMGTGESEGENRAIEAAQAAISNPLLDEVSMQGARGVLINISGGMDLTLFEVDQAANRIREEVDPEANIIFGSVFDQRLEGRMRVSVVATGIDADRQGERPRAVPLSLIVSRSREEARSGRETAAQTARDSQDTGQSSGPDTTPAERPEPTSRNPATDPEPAGGAAKPGAGEAGNSEPSRDGRTTVFRVEPPAGRQAGTTTLRDTATPEPADPGRPSEPAGTEPSLREVASPAESGETQTETPSHEAARPTVPEALQSSDDAPSDDNSSVVPMRAASGPARKYKPFFRPSQKPAARTEADTGQEENAVSEAASPADEPGAQPGPDPAGADARQGLAETASAAPEGGPRSSKRGGFFSWVSGRGSNQLEEHFEKGDRYYYGQGVRKNLGLALRSYHKAAEMGHAAAQNRLGWMYEKGEGVEADHAEAVKWYLRAAEQGHVNAMNDLGYMYRQGWGVPQSYGEALQWFRKAAEKYDSYAEYNMGQMYENGWGVERDLEEAVRWFRRSAARGHEWAAKRLEELGIKS